MCSFLDYEAKAAHLKVNLSKPDDNNNILEFPGADNFNTVLGFGQDVNNELYLLNGSGQLLKIQAPGTSYTPPENTGEDAQCTSEDFCFPIVAANGNIASVCL